MSYTETSKVFKTFEVFSIVTLQAVTYG